MICKKKYSFTAIMFLLHIVKFNIVRNALLVDTLIDIIMKLTKTRLLLKEITPIIIKKKNDPSKLDIKNTQHLSNKKIYI